MAPEDTIRKQAHDLVSAHGEDAPIEAAMQAQAFFDRGDLAGGALWGRIGNMTNVLLSKTTHAAVLDPMIWSSGPPSEAVHESPDLSDLPSPNITRWHVHHKATVVTAVQKGLLDIAEACARYKITVEEFLSWKRLLDEHGMQGLRATRLKEYRHAASSVPGDGGPPEAAKAPGSRS
jgi:hypothetical protein